MENKPSIPAEQLNDLKNMKDQLIQRRQQDLQKLSKTDRLHISRGFPERAWEVELQPISNIEYRLRINQVFYIQVDGKTITISEMDARNIIRHWR